MRRKKVIWIMGSNGAGKTTQSLLLHERFKTAEKQIIQIPFRGEKSDKTWITTYGRIGHVGKVLDNQCTGTDTLSTKEQIEFAFYSLLERKEVDIIVIDGIMATATWSIFINSCKFITGYKTYVVLLNFFFIEENFKRIEARRFFKNRSKYSKEENLSREYFRIPSELELSEKTKENISGKIKGFKRMFDKVKLDFNDFLEMEATLKKKGIHETIVEKFKLR